MKSEPQLMPMTVLLVEDHQDTREAMRDWFNMEGHSVIEVNSMASALDVARQKPFDLLLCDVQLPDGDAWELLRRLKAPRPFVGVAMSGHCAPADLARSKAAGFFAHLVKPFGTEIQSTLADAQRELERRRNGGPENPPAAR